MKVTNNDLSSIRSVMWAVVVIVLFLMALLFGIFWTSNISADISLLEKNITRLTTINNLIVYRLENMLVYHTHQYHKNDKAIFYDYTANEDFVNYRKWLFDKWLLEQGIDYKEAFSGRVKY